MPTLCYKKDNGGPSQTWRKTALNTFVAADDSVSKLTFCLQTMSAKEKGKFEDLARQDKARYEREMMSYVPVRGGKKKKFKDPNAPKRPP